MLDAVRTEEEVLSIAFPEEQSGCAEKKAERETKNPIATFNLF